jgi:hypothetical protein
MSPDTMRKAFSAIALGSVASLAAALSALGAGAIPAGASAGARVHHHRHYSPRSHTIKDTAGTPLPFGSARTTGGVASSAKNPPVAIAAAAGTQGYWIATANGTVLPYNGAPVRGSLTGTVLRKPIVGMAATPDGKGYWLVGTDGGIFSFGSALFHGSTGHLNLAKPIVGMTATRDGKGYWFVAADGGVFAFGDARFHGSMGGKKIAKPIVGMATTPDGKGYWLVASDGGIFAFGDARYLGSAARDHPLGTIIGMASSPLPGGGYWLASSDGGVYSFGARFYGSAASPSLPCPIRSIAVTPDGKGYWLLPTTPAPPTGPPPLPPGFVRGHVTAIGDSVMVDQQPDLYADIPHIDVNAVVGRYWDDGVAVAGQLRRQDSLGATIVVDLGTNGPVDVAQFQAMMSVLSGATLVVFVTIHLPPSYSWSQSVNATLRQEVPKYPNARLADFNALADRNPQWFGADGVHMPIGGPGAQAMASLITATIRSAEGQVP